jgi:UDP-GlcNAc:undecaprenyl-phosphate GlcNAc-1-phosphate transferase
MPPIKLFYIFITALMASLMIMPSLYNLSIKVGGVDMPDQERKIHDKAIPRIGGIAILCGLLISVMLFCTTSPFLSGLVTGGLIIFFVGFIDDLRNLTPFQKLAGQIIGASVGVIISQNHLKTLGNLFSQGSIDLHPGIAIPFTIFCIVGLINSLNMIDGLDGLAGGVSAIACLALAILALETGALQVFLVTVALLGAVIGFLAHNSYPARIFMGDAGSNLLGFTLGMLAVRLLDVSPGISPVAILIILSVPVFDTLYVIVRRLVSGRPVMSPDRAHLHHRLLDIGLGHKASVLAVYGWTYLMAAVAVLSYDASDSSLSLFILVAIAIFYLLLSAIPKCWSVNNYQVSTDMPFLKTSWSEAMERFCRRLLLLARYLVVIILAITVTVDLEPNLYFATTAAVLLCSLLLGIAFNFTWSNHLLLATLYLTGVYLIFEAENFGRSATLWNFSVLTLSAYLFAVIGLLVGIKIFIRKRYNILMNSALEFSVLLAVIFVPLMPDQIAATYHLLTVAGKSIILFVAYKLFLISNDARRNRVVIMASLLALIVSMINRII